jgi:hypothetical protein
LRVSAERQQQPALGDGDLGQFVAVGRHPGQHLGVITGASSVLSIDGTETTGSLTGTVVAGAVQIVGSAATTCNFAEFIYWDNYGLTSAERTALVANQRAFWGTP